MNVKIIFLIKLLIFSVIFLPEIKSKPKISFSINYNNSCPNTRYYSSYPRNKFYYPRYFVSYPNTRYYSSYPRNRAYYTYSNNSIPREVIFEDSNIYNDNDIHHPIFGDDYNQKRIVKKKVLYKIRKRINLYDSRGKLVYNSNGTPKKVLAEISTIKNYYSDRTTYTYKKTKIL